MAVRKIPKNHLFVTGSFASQKNDEMNEYESPLEKEFMVLLEFDKTIERFETQPITVPIPGVSKGYTPDVLIYYLPNPHTGETAKPVLTEVKHTDDLKQNEEKYRVKFELAEIFAEERGWEFRITNQHDIRIPRLDNLKFLRAYRNIDPNEGDRNLLINMAKEFGEPFTAQMLIAKLAKTENDRLHWLPIIWHAVLCEDLLIDWNRPLNNDTAMTIAQDGL